MKQITDLKTRIKDRNFFLSQFARLGEKNILFVNPMLSGKYLYKMILPYLLLPKSNIATAITSLNDYNINEQMVGYKALDIMNTPDSQMMITWATHIVFPMTLQPLTELYSHIRQVNPKCKVLYNIDFNFSELLPANPLKHYFEDEMISDYVWQNIYHADTVFISNGKEQEYLVQKLTELVQTKFANVPRHAINEEIKIHFLPLLSNDSICLANITEYEDPKNILLKVGEEKKSEPIALETGPPNLAKKKRLNKPKIKIQKVVKKVTKPKKKKK